MRLDKHLPAMALWAVAVALMALLSAGCTTSGPKEPVADLEAPAPLRPESGLPEKLKLQLRDTTLGDAVRRIGDETGGRLAIMNGIEQLPLSRVNFVNQDHVTVAKGLADASKVAMQVCPNYSFLYPAGYEALTTFALADGIHPRYQGRVDQIAFTSGIPLHAIFNWLGQAFGLTIVADNEVAAAECGALALRDLPLNEAVEAILKSSRTTGIAVECTEEYLFLQAVTNPSPASALLQADRVDERQRAVLDRVVTVKLPRPAIAPDRIETVPRAMPLRDVLTSLSEQIGFRVVAEQGLEDFPVNPVTLSEVRVETAMNLIIRQWLVPGHGYQVTGDRIVIRRRAQGE